MFHSSRSSVQTRMYNYCAVYADLHYVNNAIRSVINDHCSHGVTWCLMQLSFRNAVN